MPNIDLFTTRFNRQCLVHVSQVSDSQILDVDTLAISWEGLDAYAYSPPMLVPRVLQQIQQFHCHLKMPQSSVFSRSTTPGRSQSSSTLAYKIKWWCLKKMIKPQTIPAVLLLEVMLYSDYTLYSLKYIISLLGHIWANMI